MISVTDRDEEIEENEVTWSLKERYIRRELNEKIEGKLDRVFDYLDHHAARTPDKVAIIEYNTGEEITFKQFSQATKAFACLLHSYGLKKGDVITTALPYLKEHLYLMIGAFRLGVIVSPLDLRLRAHEIVLNFEKIQPKMHFFLGKTNIKRGGKLVDFRPIVEEVKSKVDCVKHWIQFQKETDGVIDGAIHVKTFAKNIKYHYVWNILKESFCCAGLSSIQETVKQDDGTFIIFTTGSTGTAKPALLSHEGFILQLWGNVYAFYEPIRRRKNQEVVGLAHLPPSHIGGLSQFFSSLAMGSVCVLMHVFHPEKSLDAIQKHKINVIGQIPALFNLQWKLDNYDDFDLSSLLIGIYGGQGVSKSFLERMKTMCNGGVGGTYGCTEVSGIAIFTPFDGSLEEISSSLGYGTDHCPLSIRSPMKEDGTAGDELQKGETGEICFTGKQLFLGYYGMEEETKKVLSTDGVLYTGDMGSYDFDNGGLKFASRRKFVIKPKGFQVFPPEVEDFIINSTGGRIRFCAVVGIEHEVYSDGVVAVIKLKEESESDENINMKKKEEEDDEEGEGEGDKNEKIEEKRLTVEEVMKVCEGLASYKKPSLVVILEKDEEFPLNRVMKTDYLKIREIAQERVKMERLNGGWDAKKK